MLADGMGSGASLPANARAGKPPSLARMAISPPQLANGLELDCYPHTFSPLLLFAPGAYFDKGYSNYHSVAQFFACVAGEDMLANVLCERRNALYEDLLDDVFAKRSLVTCCIDAHFTAFQVLPTQRGEPPLMVYYDPLKNQLQLFAGDAARRAATFLLLKCHYGDSTHIQEHADHYTGAGGTATRRMIHQLWRDMNKVSGLGQLSGCRSRGVALNASSYFLINAPGDARSMSTQLTGNTCYFQTYLFAVLAKVGGLSLCKVGGGAVDVTDALRLEKTTVAMCQHLLGFFVDDSSKMMRPLTNSNVVVDFFRFREAPYYALVSRYLKGRANVPDYAAQHARLLEYFCARRTLHTYSKFTLVGAMPSAQNTKSLIAVTSTDEAAPKLARSHFYKYRAADLMLGLNTGVVQELRAFCEFNALRKNALLGAFDRLEALLGAPPPTNKFRDYYFMPQYEVGQTELVAVHAHTYALDVLSMLLRHKRYCEADVLPAFRARVRLVNSALAESVLFSTQRQTDYETILRPDEFSNSKKTYDFFRDTFLSVDFFQEFCGLGLSDRNLAEPDVNALTRTVFYSTKLMARQAYKMESDFEKECINQLARTTLRRYNSALQGRVDLDQTCRVCIRVGFGVTYSKYNTLMHFLNVAEAYWHNPDLAAVSLFGKDVRAVLGVSCQKIFFQPGHDFYHYGPFELQDGGLDLAVANAAGDVLPGVSRAVRGEKHALIVTDRVFEHGYLKSILQRLFRAAEGYKLKTDNAVINLLLLSLLLDFGLFEDHVQLLNLPLLASLPQKSTRALQVEVSNLIHEADKRNSSDPVTRAQVEHLIFEVSHKFMVNKAWSLRSREFELVRLLNADPCYMRYVLLVKVYMSLCQINKSAEVDYYKVRTDSAFRILIPRNFSQSTSAYLAEITMRYTFAEKGGFVVYDDLKLFDVREAQPEMNLFKVRIDSASSVQSMVKYVEISNVFKSVEDGGRADEFLVFVADNVLRCAVDGGQTRVRINGVVVEVATTFFNECISFVPCFKYAASEDVIFFCSRNVKYAVDNGGQFSPDYYGMKHELIECIYSEECTVDLNDAHVFKKEKISDLVTESKTVLFFPDFVLQVTDRKQLINLLDYALAIRNVGFFILVLFYLRRASVHLEYAETENKVTKIAGPWREAILYVLDKASPNPHYDEIFARQFSDLHAHADLPLADFVDELCKCFCRYQRSITHDDGSSGYEIVPTRKQKDFLMKILISEECFHFSEVGSGKTKVVLPLLCMAFLSDNSAVQQILARGGKKKSVLVILVPEHLVPDAKAQVYRYCLNLNFRDEYRVYDDIFALRTAAPGNETPRRTEASRMHASRREEVMPDGDGRFQRRGLLSKNL